MSDRLLNFLAGSISLSLWSIDMGATCAQLPEDAKLFQMPKKISAAMPSDPCRGSLLSWAWNCIGSVHDDLPTAKPSLPVETAAKLPLRLHDLSLHDSELDDSLAILRPNPRQPNALSGTGFLTRTSIVQLSLLFHHNPVSTLKHLLPAHSRPPIHHHVGAELVAPNMTDEVDTHTAGPFVV